MRAVTVLDGSHNTLQRVRPSHRVLPRRPTERMSLSHLIRTVIHSQVGTRGVDVFFDNVGGMILNETLRRLNQHGRVVVCGAIASYNVDDPRDDVVAPTNYMALISLRARMEGFIVFDYQSECAPPPSCRRLGPFYAMFNVHVLGGGELPSASGRFETARSIHLYHPYRLFRTSRGPLPQTSGIYRLSLCSAAMVGTT